MLQRQWYLGLYNNNVHSSKVKVQGVLIFWLCSMLILFSPTGPRCVQTENKIIEYIKKRQLNVDKRKILQYNYTYIAKILIVIFLTTTSFRQLVVIDKQSVNVTSASRRVADPHLFHPDPDPDPIRIRIQSGSRALWTKNLKKITAERKFNVFWIKNYNLPIPRPP